MGEKGGRDVCRLSMVYLLAAVLTANVMPELILALILPGLIDVTVGFGDSGWESFRCRIERTGKPDHETPRPDGRGITHEPLNAKP